MARIPQEERELIQNLCREGKSFAEIAKITGRDEKHTIPRICREAGIYSLRLNERLSDDDIMNRLPVGLFYINEYCDDNSDIEIACEKCGNSFFRKGQTVRKGMLKTCPICDLIEREEQKYIAEMDKLFKANRKEEEREQRELERLNSIETRTCEICGEKFVTTKKSRAVCCSSECSKKRANRLASKKHDKRIVPSKRIDKGIDARSLFRRDKGVCWICGGQCNLEDYTMRGETFIAGDWYPSVDHIIPICEGGEDSWENVKLAHRKCNSQRYYQEKDSPLVKNF